MYWYDCDAGQVPEDVNSVRNWITQNPASAMHAVVSYYLWLPSGTKTGSETHCCAPFPKPTSRPAGEYCSRGVYTDQAFFAHTIDLDIGEEWANPGGIFFLPTEERTKGILWSGINNFDGTAIRLNMTLYPTGTGTYSTQKGLLHRPCWK